MKYQQHNYATSEQEYKHFLAPAITEIMADLSLGVNSKILDAGCGPGSMLPYLAGINRDSSLIGLDASVSHLSAAKKIIEDSQLSDRVQLVEHDLFEPLPFEDESFDLVWISDVLFPDDTGEATMKILRELKRILNKNGRLIIFYGNWLRFQLLPGYSRLENTIHVVNELSKSHPQEWSPELHPEKCANWLGDLQFSDIDLSVKPVFYQAPLEPRIKSYIHWHLEHIYSKALKFSNEQFSPCSKQKELFEEITNPNHPSYVLDNPFYWCSVSPIVVFAKV